MIKSFIKENLEGLVAKAYEFAKKAHNGQKRLTGEPYFNHLIATAEQLVKWKLDDICIAAGLLHDVLEENVPIGKKVYSFIHLKNPEGEFIAIQEKKRNELNALTLSGGIIINKEAFPSFVEHINHINKKMNGGK